MFVYVISIITSISRIFRKSSSKLTPLYLGPGNAKKNKHNVKTSNNGPGVPKAARNFESAFLSREEDGNKQQQQ